MKVGRSKTMSCAELQLEVQAIGAGGIQELQQSLDNSTVSWALLRFQVGSGTFTRTKLVAIHSNGDYTPPLERGHLNVRTTEALELLGNVHAIVPVTDSSQLTLEYLCERLLPLFIADDIGSYTLRRMQEEYASTLQTRTMPRANPWTADKTTTRIVTRHVPSRCEVLRAVCSDRGRYNWVMLDPDTQGVHEAGAGGIDELKNSLRNDRVLFGVLRLSFGLQGGEGKARPSTLTKHVFVHWAGPSVKAVQRGRWKACASKCEVEVRKLCALALRKEALENDDLTLDGLLRDLKRLTVVDTGIGEKKRDTCISAEAYYESLEIEHRCVQESTSPSEFSDAVSSQSVRSIVKTTRDDAGEWNWMLLGIATAGIGSWRQSPVDRSGHAVLSGAGTSTRSAIGGA